MRSFGEELLSKNYLSKGFGPMLNIYFDDMPAAIYNTEVYFTKDSNLQPANVTRILQAMEE